MPLRVFSAVCSWQTSCVLIGKRRPSPQSPPLPLCCLGREKKKKTRWKSFVLEGTAIHPYRTRVPFPPTCVSHCLFLFSSPSLAISGHTQQHSRKTPNTITELDAVQSLVHSSLVNHGFNSSPNIGPNTSHIRLSHSYTICGWDSWLECYVFNVYEITNLINGKRPWGNLHSSSRFPIS